MKFFLDTDICIYLINGKSQKLLSRLTRTDPEKVFVSSVTVFELEYGVQKSKRLAENSLALAKFLSAIQVVPFDEEAARETAVLRVQLEQAGKPIGGYDLMIAGHARVSGATLVTNNLREFNRVPGLTVTNWE